MEIRVFKDCFSQFAIGSGKGLAIAGGSLVAGSVTSAALNALGYPKAGDTSFYVITGGILSLAMATSFCGIIHACSSAFRETFK